MSNRKDRRWVAPTETARWRAFSRNFKRKMLRMERRQWGVRPDACHPKPLWMSAGIDGHKYHRKQRARKRRT